MTQYTLVHFSGHRRLWLTLALLALLAGMNWFQQQAIKLRANPANGPATVAVVQASDWPVSDAQVDAMVRQAVQVSGGLSAVIHLSDTVVLKPNLMWDAAPDEGYTTDPRVVRALVRLAREAGAGQVIIADGAASFRDMHDARGATAEAFHACGYDADRDRVDDETGARLVDLNDAGGVDQHDPTLVTQVNIPNGLIWNSYWLPRVMMEADVVIGVPVLKNHNQAGMTLALKGQIGLAPSDIYHDPNRQFLKGALGHSANDLGRHIVDLNLARPLDFVVVDGLRGMTDGPNGGTLIHPRMRLIMAGRDPVAVDTAGALVMGYDPATIPYLSRAAGVGLGVNDVSRITVRGERVSRVRRDFPVPYGDPPAQRADSTPPTVHITWPEKGTLVTETATIQATAGDDQSVAKVEFYIGDELVSTVPSFPYQATVDLSNRVGQALTLRAVAYDRALNDAEESVSVAVVRTPKAGAATFQTTAISIPTYLYTPFLHLRYDGPYPYRWLEWGPYGNTTSAPQDYQLLVLDNDYVRVTLLPELGGRVYQMIWKPTGHNELYQNPVIKPTHWGPLEAEENWWLAVGGIEWGLPVEEHGYEWGEPWAWNVVTSTHGVTVTVRDTQALDRLRAAVELFLPADRAYLAVTPRLENPTGEDLTFKYWTNAMLAPGASNTVSPDLRFIFSSNEVTVHSSGDAGSRVPNAGDPMPWPVYGGHDFSRLGNWRQWLGFFERPQAATDFIGVYDTTSDEGVARIFPSNVARGTKGFGMGWSDPIDPSTWTDDGSAYVELHGGVAPTFWDSAQLAAGATLTWTEYWYPVSSIGILSTATAEAVLGIREDSGSLNIGVHSTVARAEGRSILRVWEEATCAPLARVDLPAIDPAHPFNTLLPMGGRTLNQVTIGYLDDQGHVLAGHRPANCPTPEARVEPLPPWVETTTFTVTWVQVGDAMYHVQFRDGYEAAWTDWLTNTGTISATFTGGHGHTYLFRARNVSISQPFTNEEWGQAFTTVLTEPASVLVTSYKTATWSVTPVLSGTVLLPVEVMSYTVLLSNTGNLAAGAIITDPVPPGMSVIPQSLTADGEPQPVYSDGVIQWSGAVHAGESVRLRFALAPTALQRGDKITNTVEIAGSVLGPFTRQTVTVWAWPVFLPVVFRQ